MRHHEKLRARKLLTDWLQTLMPEDRHRLSALLSDIDQWRLKDIIESGSFAEYDAAEARKKQRLLKEKADENTKLQQDSADHQHRAQEFRAGREGYIPNAPSDLPIYPKLAEPPKCVHPERTNCNYDLVNERCEFMEYLRGEDIGRGYWRCGASPST